MEKHFGASKTALCSAIIVGFALCSGCAEVRLNTIPTPPPSAKLRVFVKTVSGESRPGAPFSHEEWTARQTRLVSRLLQRAGVYELPREEEVQAVLGSKPREEKLRWPRT